MEIKAGEAAVKKLEKMSPEEREAFEKSFNSAENIKRRDDLKKQIASQVASLPDMLRRVPDIGQIDTGKHPAEFLEEIAGAFHEQNEILREQIETIRQTSEQSDEIARKANCLSKFAVGAALVSALAAVVSFICR